MTDRQEESRALPRVARTVAALPLAIACVLGVPGHAGEFEPLCADLETEKYQCWNPVEVADHPGCHVFGHMSYFDHAPPMRWSSRCQDGKALGVGVAGGSNSGGLRPPHKNFSAVPTPCPAARTARLRCLCCGPPGKRQVGKFQKNR